LFDDDRGYIFNYAETNITVSTEKQTAFLIRLAPSVSNAVTGDLGERELLNRAQLLLSGIEITSDGTSGGSAVTGGIIVEGVLNPQNYPANPGDVTWSGLGTLAQGGQPSFAQVASGGSIVWATGGPSTANITVQSDMTVTGVINADTVDARGRGRDDFVLISSATYASSGIRVGAKCNTTPFNNATVVAVQPDGGDYRVDFDQTATNEGTNYSAGSLSLSFTFTTQRSTSTTTFITQASWDAAGVLQGSAVDASDTNFPAGTIVNTVIGPLNFGTTDYYEVRFNNPSTGTLSGTDTIVMSTAAASYAQPGETVFSLISQPGERSTLDLNQLKELTTTTLGGRGTFPNGPDVLAINIYKVSGNDTNANILLRWGEAQA